jgi:aspartyl-tRNA(Asn)/glutamyl-tRNA(Gln) amidotransferase subunit A
MAGIHALTAWELHEAYRAGSLSPVEVWEAVLARYEQLNPKVNAFVWVDEEGASAAARASEERWRRESALGPLDGIPVSVKDLVPTRGMPTLLGSRTVERNQPWAIDAPAVANLRRHGAIIFGKTTTSEFGNKIVTESPGFGITRNPWDLERSPGGSSGGAGAAVAAGIGPIALATDGGGSVRIPSSWCGVVGLKPSYKIVPAPTPWFDWLSVTGIIARSVRDIAATMNVLTSGGYDLDCQATEPGNVNFEGLLEAGVDGVRIAFSPGLGIADVEPSIARRVAAAAGVFKQLGAQVEEVAVPPLADYVASRMHSTQWIVRLASIIDDIPADKRALVDPDNLELAAFREHISLVDYRRALDERCRLAHEMHLFFRDWDLLICPTFHVGPPPVPGLPKDLQEAPRLTSWVNQTMQPAVSIPCGLDSEGLPVGLQLIGSRHNEPLVLRAARAYEQARDPFLGPWSAR